MSRKMKTDYLIAGCGIAGAILAGKLAGSGKKVVVLDQGPRFEEQERVKMIARARETLNDFADYNDEAVPGTVTPHTSARQEGEVAEWAAQRLFGVGGSALHFEGFMIRPREEDFKVRTLYGYGRDWPISYAEIEPWLLRAEHETGVSGNEDNPYASPRSGPFPMPAHAFSYFDREIFIPAMAKMNVAAHSCPRAINSVPYRGRSACLACRACKFCPSGARYSPDRVHVPIMDKNPNVTLLENVSLRRLETDPGSSRVVAAHAVGVREKDAMVISAEKFILALGGVETPRMLMLSAGNGDHRKGLGNLGGQLGRHFGDHTNPFLVYDVGRPVGSRLGFETVISDHFRARKDRAERPGFMLFASPAVDWIPTGHFAAGWATKGDVLSLDALRSTISRIASVYVMTELKGEGTLELDTSSTDAFGSPVAKVTMPLGKWDRQAQKELSALAPKIGDAMGATRMSEVAPPEFGLGYHPSGATAMAKSPDGGVCDANLKVFGLSNLYLVSNSVFPQMGPNPPTLTIAALALRLAAHLEGGAAS